MERDLQPWQDIRPLHQPCTQSRHFVKPRRQFGRLRDPTNRHGPKKRTGSELRLPEFHPVGRPVRNYLSRRSAINLRHDRVPVLPAPLSVPSETLQLRAASTSSKLIKFSPQKGNALIGPVDYEGDPALVIKFRYRGNIRGCCILIRPRICHEVAKLARRQDVSALFAAFGPPLSATPPRGPSVPENLRKFSQPTAETRDVRPPLRPGPQVLITRI